MLAHLTHGGSLDLATCILRYCSCLKLTPPGDPPYAISFAVVFPPTSDVSAFNLAPCELYLTGQG